MGWVKRRAKLALMSGPLRPPSRASAASIAATTLEYERSVTEVICHVRASSRPRQSRASASATLNASP